MNCTSALLLSIVLMVVTLWNLLLALMIASDLIHEEITLLIGFGRKLLSSQVITIFDILFTNDFNYINIKQHNNKIQIQKTPIKVSNRMSKINQQDLQTFLIEAQLTHKKIKDLVQNKISSQQFDKQQQLRKKQKIIKQQLKIKKQKQIYLLKTLGRQGKGISKNFIHFCKYCHRQYQLPTPMCIRCNRYTMTLQQRQKQLEEMVNQYKNKKKKRQQRKMKWDMWQKTKAMLWKKTNNNYDKWQYFVSDSQQQPQNQPIVPKDDPNFKALQRDMQQRKSLRIKQTQKAKALKQKGNKAMKQQNYQQAMQLYTLALQHIKDIKSIYTNRALAFIKLKKFNKAIKDCNDVIQYMEVFQKINDNKDLVFKAYLRKALAQKQLKLYQQALVDINNALKICQNDKTAEMLKKQIQGFILHSENVERILREDKKKPELPEIGNQQKNASEQNQQQQHKQNNNAAPTEDQSQHVQNQIVKQLAQAQLQQEHKPSQASQNQQKKQPNKENDNKKPSTQQNKQKILQKKHQVQKTPVEEIKQIIENLNQQNIAKIFHIFKQKPELISIFIAGKGIHKCIDQLIKNQQCKKEGFLVSVCLRGDGVGEKEVWDYGIIKIYSRVSQILQQTGQLNMGKYFILQDIFQILIPMSLHQKYRVSLSQCIQTHKFLQKTFTNLIKKYKKFSDLFSLFLIYMSNLCSGISEMRDKFIDQKIFKIINLSLYQNIIRKKTVNKSLLTLKKNSYNLISNMIINEKHRFELIQLFNEKELIGEVQVNKWQELITQIQFYPKVNQNFTEYILALFSVFANVLLGTSINIDGLAQCINSRFISNPKQYQLQVINRALLILSRVRYDNTRIFNKMLINFGNNLQVFKKNGKGEKNAMEHIVRIVNIIYQEIKGQNKFNEELPINLFTQFKLYISNIQYGEILFCNTCNLFCVILDRKIDYRNVIYQELKIYIKFLIQVAKDKVGNWRKNAAILLAKLSINSQCKEQLYKYHGMDVLKSIAQFVKQN